MRMGKVADYLKLVKFEHTLFALPFALTGFFLAATRPEARLSLRLLLLVLLCMVFARNAAMGFNRWLDRHFDSLNPRTAGREIPAGIIRPGAALLFVAANALLFMATTWFINLLCFLLAPAALFVILFYSYTKRITPLCHFVLSLGLAIAPVGAYLAVAGHFHWPPLLVGGIVFFWASGFDIIYALQDEEFDNRHRLRSLPALLGKRQALRLSSLLHAITALLVAAFALAMRHSFLHLAGALIFLLLLLYQHLIVKHDDLSRVNLAFFTTNGVASVVYAALVIAGLLLS